MRGAPDVLAVRPKPIDVLSDVLRSVHLKGAVFFDFHLRAPWAVEAPHSRDIAGRVMPHAQRVIEYHLIAEGNAWANAIGDEPLHLEKGDIIMFPQGDPHVMSSRPGMREPPQISAFDNVSTQRPVVMKLGGSGDEHTRIVCCFLGIDERPFNPLLAALPRVIHLPARFDSTTTWLANLMSTAASESGSERAGSENVLARLAELMFVETVRRHLETLPHAQSGWLAGLKDPVVGPALVAMHTSPQDPWTVERLAKSAHTSRSVLAERFTDMVGQSPMLYLALWRMQIASRLLTEGGSIAAAAAAVGYESEAAFHRAFKKLVGTSPGAWKKSAH